jgi:flagellar biosynthetic protein FlhB
MADTPGGERNLKPTAKRLREARKRGQIARSRDLTAAAAFLAAIAVLAFRRGAMASALQTLMARGLGTLDVWARQPASTEALVDLGVSSAIAVAGVVGPIAFASVATGVGVSLLQGGINFSLTPLQPDLARLLPTNGLQRWAPGRAGLDTVKAMIGATIVTVIAWRVGQRAFADAPYLVGSPVAITTSRVWGHLLTFLWQAGGAIAVLGAADYALQRWRLMSSLKMTRQEVQEEARSEEGRPEVKARIRRLQRDLSRRRMLRDTARATVVITNPTHYAVALEYRREKMAAPVVVAKGRDLVAARIREVARANNVPIVENPPLARALHAGAEIGDVIPPALFGAVAEVLAYLVRIRQLML